MNDLLQFVDIPAHRNNNNTDLYKCQLKLKFWNLYTIFTTTMDVSACTLAISDYDLILSW